MPGIHSRVPRPRQRSLPFVALLLFVLLSLQGLAQTNAAAGNVVRGKVEDATTAQPIEFATISLLGPGGVPVGGAASDEQGTFTIAHVPLGTYSLRGAFVGYTTITLPNVVIDGPPKDLGIIQLHAIDALRTVVVAKDRAILRNGIDKKVFEVEKSVVSEGGSATDVLKDIPTVSVDVDGNLSLRGSGNIAVLIDGKLSGLTGGDRAAILDQIPASSIQSVELITNPSSQYDPDGMSGIINIILKKNREKATNSSITVAAGSRNKYNASLTVNYHRKRINAYLNYGFRHGDRYTSRDNLRKNIFADTTFHLNQYITNHQTSDSHLLKLGAEYTLDDHNTINVNLTGNVAPEDEHESIKYNNLDLYNTLTRIYYRDNHETNTGNSFDLSGGWTHTFAKPEQELNTSLSYSGDINDQHINFVQQNYHLDNTPTDESPGLQNTFYKTVFGIAALQADYKQPLSAKSTLKAGYKGTLRNYDNDFTSESYNYATAAYKNDTAYTNRFTYTEQIHAVYAIFSTAWKDFGFELGARAEQALTHAHLFATNAQHEHDYFNVYPSMRLSRKLAHEQELQLSYSMRVNRPNVRNLNPFPEYTDPLNLRYGNPDLNPEYVHAYELSYARTLPKMSLTSTLYYRQITGIIQQVRTILQNGGSTTIVHNLTSGTSSGVELVARNELFAWWNLTSNFNFFQTRIDGGGEGELNSNSLSWSVKEISAMTILGKTQLQISGNYQAPTTIAQGTNSEMYWVDAGIRKDLLKHRATVSFNVSDIFDTRKSGSYTSGPNFTQEVLRKRESRIAFLSFTWKFGSEDARKAKKENEGGGDETE